MFPSEEILPFPVETVVHAVAVDEGQCPELLERLLMEKKSV